VIWRALTIVAVVMLLGLLGLGLLLLYWIIDGWRNERQESALTRRHIYGADAEGGTPWQ
jgi:hypothetical protein